jgi:flagellar protein FlbD
MTVERTPDTVITLTTGARIMTKEPVEEIVDRVVRFRQRLAHSPIVRDPEQE